MYYKFYFFTLHITFQANYFDSVFALYPQFVKYGMFQTKNFK